MSSSASALSSASTSTPTTYFSGMSTYSASLNASISQAVQIADLPIQLLQNDVNNLTNQTTELQTLNTDFTSVQSAVTSLASAAGDMLAASVSDGSATATLGSAATAGSYSLGVTNLGSYSNALSNDGLTTVTDPTSQDINASDSFTLTVTNGGGAPATTPISFSGGSLNVLAQAINEAGAGVQATVVDVGSNSAPDYRLSLQSDQLGPVTMQLNDGSQNLMTASGALGALAQYSINGQAVSSDSDSVTLAPGLTVQLTGTNSTPATVTVAADPSGVGSALQALVSAYNTANTELGNNRGQTDVALAGQSIVYQLTESLQSLAGYSGGSGNISSLEALGVSFDDTTGQLSFDQSTFDSATSGQTTALTQFLGSATGGGYLEAATNTMAGILDPTTGVLTQDISSIQSNIASTNTQITAKQTQVTQLQSNLTQQMAAADAAIYDLQQQASEMQDMFTAEQDSEMTGSL
ncbi:MAG TPA: flagellar filament capping protein FliD [Bryobacteraceae bacterium]|jgi:flagellar hook-associated protein 2|nr:flagellar filament capping protein FliD [Bryobacteraceae bacterium]